MLLSIMLITEGFLEARNRRGKLYGFERVERLLARGPSPDEVIAITRDFGQDDDLTVLTLTRVA